MSALAVFLVAVGLADISRKVTAYHWLPTAMGPAPVIAAAVLAGLWHPGDIALLITAGVCSALWIHLGTRAEEFGRHQVSALISFGAGFAVLAGLAGWASPVGGPVARWLEWVGLAHVVAPGRALMIAGVVLVQLVTANQLVRLILGAVGAIRPAGEPQPSDRLKGGRLLGPMERLLIVGLGLGGQFAVASAVVAAKGIIRFPELSAQRKDSEGASIDALTEYFLVGSFASWLLAMGGLALAV